MALLSPEEYLNQVVSVDPSLKEYNPSPKSLWDITPEVQTFKIMPWFDRYLRGPGDGFIRCLRARRFLLTDADDGENAASSDFENKYARPAVRIAQKYFEWTWSTPPLDIVLERSPRGDWRTFLISSGHAHHWNAFNSTTVDWRWYKKCFCAIIFVDNDIIRPADFPPRETPVFSSTTLSGQIVMDLLDIMTRTRCGYAIVTDERTTLVCDRRENGYPHLDIVDPSQITIRRLIANFIYTEAVGCKMCFLGSYYPAFLGALNDYSNVDDDAFDFHVYKHGKRSFRDFDVYSMQRVPGEWWRFYWWKRWVEKEALLTTIEAESTLSINVGGFSRRHLLHRSPFPSIPLPQETLDIATLYPRPRDTSLDALLEDNVDLTFKVTKVIRSGPNHWSQVFLGHLADSERIVCLKVFDERFFHMPAEPDYEDTFWYPPHKRLTTFNAAVELVQREESVYDRIRYLQGSLIPHCYGFHEITMPDGWKWYGILMEVIDGPSLGKIGATAFPSDVQSDLITRLRHCLRALKFAGIQQTDWNPDNLICPPVLNNGNIIHDIVFIDFAFACQSLEDTVMPSDEIELFAEMLKGESVELPGDLVDALWLPPLEPEY